MASVAVMAHPRRRGFVEDLVEQLGCDPYVAWDRRDEEWDTGRRALAAHNSAAAHHIVVQDDAILCRDFLAGAEAAVAAAGEHPVGFYIGAVDSMPRIAASVEEAREAGASWLAMPGPLWGVAIALPTAHIDDVIKWGDAEHHTVGYDGRITRSYRRLGLDCWYPLPSLVDHHSVAQNPSLFQGRTTDRTAYWFLGERSARDIDWGTPAHTVGDPRQKGVHVPEHRIADRRIYGYDRKGRQVLVAAKGQPIPPGFVVDAPAETEAVSERPAVEDVAPGPVKAQAAAEKPKRARGKRLIRKRFT